ncbi:hypothetical protein J7J00_24685 [Bacillus sp. ISL-4]|uniref:hypothetical protein n=1 Tax=Bacillus sp. ISL-4 TaxID=2819125 RepID=UPI001BE7F8F2|nr:hypothetical protein [Bacillus sp. ISL-4]MBT2668630.1 hypothetical protein [Bacillus sp. ISL-4]MBT2670614.1 hypothetical protein [Streptomyces sp. ISL-14]
MIIPNFPDYLADLHHAWHQPEEHPGLPTRNKKFNQDGGGLEFLVFHRNFIGLVHEWYDKQPNADPNLLAPSWTAIPTELKVQGLILPPEEGGIDWSWNPTFESDEQRLLHRDPNDLDMATADKLGTFIESRIHPFLHNASSLVYNEKVVRSFHSPNSTWFYKIHGLVQFWWDIWELNNRMKFMPPDIQKILRP